VSSEIRQAAAQFHWAKIFFKTWLSVANPNYCGLAISKDPMTVQADERESAFRQVSRYSCHLDGSFPESTSDRSWPIALIRSWFLIAVSENSEFGERQLTGLGANSPNRPQRVILKLSPDPPLIRRRKLNAAG
jgi:hypothetical protein